MLINILVWTSRTLLAGLVGLVILVALLRFIPPAVTPLMFQRITESPIKGNSALIRQSWVSYGNVSPWVFRGVIGGEDGKFMSHSGVDWKAVDRARSVNASRQKRGRPPLGASTISMQTAKNVFLLPIRSIVRKAIEVGLTYGIEFLWGKKRILEVYVNMIEWGDGIYGIQAAAQHYFHKDAKDLSRDEAARLCAVIPNPRRFHADAPSSYTQRRTAFIRGRMGVAIPK